MCHIRFRTVGPCLEKFVLFALFALLQVCLLLCLRITSMLELIFSQIPPHTYKVLRSGTVWCNKNLNKKMRAFRPEFFVFKVFTQKTVPEPVLYMCVKAANLWCAVHLLIKLNERRKESCWRTSIFVNISRFIYSSTSWKLMPSDLGQPLKEARNGFQHFPAL